MKRSNQYKWLIISTLLLILSYNSIYGQNHNELVPDTTVYIVVEQMPEFPGGTSQLLSYWSNNLRFPDIDKIQIESTRVIVTFIIEKDGSATHPVIIKTIHPSYNEAILELIHKMPKWSPGRQKGVPVRVKYTFPIHFDFR